jgi:hypothetical protein
MTTSIKKSPSNALGDPGQSLQTFNLTDLQQYTRESSYSANASKDFHLFYVGRDDVHDILKHVFSRVSISLYLNMFGFDDEELNDILMEKAKDPHVMMMVTLDKSHAGGVHEKRLLDSDIAKDPAAFNCRRQHRYYRRPPSTRSSLNGILLIQPFPNRLIRTINTLFPAMWKGLDTVERAYCNSEERACNL